MAIPLANFLDRAMAQLSVNDNIRKEMNQILSLASDKKRYQLAKRLLIATNGRVNFSASLPSKNSQESEAAKSAGNVLFGNKGWKKAREEYNRALLLAPWPRNYDDAGTADDAQLLAKIYGNRSAAFFQLEQFAECISDVDSAIKYGYPRDGVRKLLERKCRAYLQKQHFKEAVDCFRNDFVKFGVISQQFFDDPSDGGDLLKLFDSAVAGLKKRTEATETPPLKARCRSRVQTEARAECMREKRHVGGPHPVFPSASASVKLEYSKAKGRHMVAASSIQAGEILVMEPSFVNSLQEEYWTTNCYSCILFTDAPQPCQGCNRVVFCSDKCANGPAAALHKKECSFLGLVQSSGPCFSIYTMVIRTLLKKTAQEWRAFAKSYRGNPLMLEDEASGVFTGIPDPTKYKWDDFRNAFCFSKKLKVAGEEKVSKVAMAATYILQLLKEKHFKDELDDELEDFLGGLVIRMFFIYTYNSAEAKEFISTSHGLCFEVEQMDFVDRFPFEAKTAVVFHPTLELFNNACNGNLVTVHYGDTVVLQAVRPIQKGEELTRIRDTQSFKDWPRDPRRQLVRQELGYLCMCQACVEDWPMKTVLLERLQEDKLPMLCPECSFSFASFKDMRKLIGKKGTCPNCKSKVSMTCVTAAARRVNEYPREEWYCASGKAHSVIKAPHPYLLEFDMAVYENNMLCGNFRQKDDVPKTVKQGIPLPWGYALEELA